MSSNAINQTPFLRTSREFPKDLENLTQEVNKSYVDIANAVNNRTISLFPTTRPAITGESWFLMGNRRQQTYRQVYNMDGFNAIDHNINYSDVSTFTVIRAIAYDGTQYYPIPMVNGASSVGITVTSTQILFFPTTFPAPASGIVILEWLVIP